MESPSKILVLAGICFFFVPVVVQGVIPLLMSTTRARTVTDVVTNTLIEVPDYTPLERRGRQVFIREGCWYCHSRYIRTVTGESFRWGPVSQTGEYAYDRPHLFSTRRTGPDLARIGRKYGDDWHMAHYWNPRAVEPDSIMPPFPWLFEKSKDGVTVLTSDGKALIAYIQRLGIAIGDWREGFVSTRIADGVIPGLTPQSRDELVALGKEIYERRCLDCHGVHGDGKGLPAQFLNPSLRDFTSGIFKFRSTKGKDSLPTDADLFITITHGLWGTAMPSWYTISERERLAVIQYIKTFSDRWQKEQVNESIIVPIEPPVTKISIEQGKTLFQSNCFICHGMQGKGDGPVSGALKDTWGNSIHPADFTLSAGRTGGVKLGHDGKHIFKTIMTGVGGTPMPPFKAQLTSGQVWDIVHYVQSLRVEAHQADLLAHGLKQADREDARKRIWVLLSEAAYRGNIDAEVVQGTK